MILYSEISWYYSASFGRGCAKRTARRLAMALARMFERSEFRSHTEQDERRCTRKSFTEDAFFGSFLLQKRNEQKGKRKDLVLDVLA